MLVAEPTVRRLQPGHLLSYLAFLRHHPREEWASPPDRAGLPSLVHFFVHSLPIGLAPGGWLAWESDQVVACLTTQDGPALDTWEIDQWLSRDPVQEDVHWRLFEELCVAARSEGVQKIFLRMKASSPLIELVSRAGFRRYTTEHTYYHLAPSTLSRDTSLAMRRRVGADHQRLFQLYSAIAPAPVRVAEGMTLQEWRSIEGWRPRYLRLPTSDAFARRDFVLDEDCFLNAWLRVDQPRRVFSLLVHPERRELIGDLLAYARSRMPGDAPITCVARDYQTELISALQEHEFIKGEESELLVRIFTARVEEPVRRLGHAWERPMITPIRHTLEPFESSPRALDPIYGR